MLMLDAHQASCTLLRRGSIEQVRALLVRGYSISGGLEAKEGCWSDSNVLCRTLLDLVPSLGLRLFKFRQALLRHIGVLWGSVRSNALIRIHRVFRQGSPGSIGPYRLQ